MENLSQGPESNQEEEYVWRFPLSTGKSEPAELDPLVEMVRVFLDDFLRIGFLTKGGEKVSVDGFAFECDPERLYAISEKEKDNGRR